MNFNKHFELEGKHAILSPSKYYWVDYEDDKLLGMINSVKAIEKGNDLHKMAYLHIKYKLKMPEDGTTISAYINDAIDFDMIPEQKLKYSNFCFGTADSISFQYEPEYGKHVLRVHDLKTGRNEADIRQLELYSAIFCLEYDIDPNDIFTELRIYQNNDILIEELSAIDLYHTIDAVVHANDVVEEELRKDI